MFASLNMGKEGYIIPHRAEKRHVKEWNNHICPYHLVRGEDAVRRFEHTMKSIIKLEFGNIYL